MDNIDKDFEKYMAEAQESLIRSAEEQGKHKIVEINETTGETTTHWVKAGTTGSYKSDEQKKHSREYYENIEGIKEFTDEQGAFVNLIFKYGPIIFKEIEDKAPGNKANLIEMRFIMLAVKTNYKGELMNDRKGIKKSDLSKIWGTSSKNSINETYDILKECGYIYETDGGYLMINKDMVIKGAMDHIKDLQKEDSSYTFTRLFVDNIEAMYYGTESRQRRQLANLFKILPYVNYKYNVFCSNPTEEDEEKIEPLNWKQLAELCGCDKSNSARLKKDLMSLNVNGQKVIGTFETGAGLSIVVNPRIYYSSNNLEAVRGIEALFRINPKK
jgi:hypothetical protein